MLELPPPNPPREVVDDVEPEDRDDDELPLKDDDVRL